MLWQLFTIALVGAVLVAGGGVEKRIAVAAYVMTATTPDAGAAVTTISLPGLTVAGVSLNPLTYAPLKQAVTHILPNLPMDLEVRYEAESTVAFGGENVTAGEYDVGGEGPGWSSPGGR